MPRNRVHASLVHQDHTDVAAFVRRTQDCDVQRPEMRRRGASPGTAMTSWLPRKQRPPPRRSTQPQTPSQMPPQVGTAIFSAPVEMQLYLLKPIDQPAN
jgi:hypothetical protein